VLRTARQDCCGLWRPGDIGRPKARDRPATDLPRPPWPALRQAGPKRLRAPAGRVPGRAVAGPEWRRARIGLCFYLTGPGKGTAPPPDLTW